MQKNEEGLYECRGRIQGCYHIYLPPDILLTERILHDKQSWGSGAYDEFCLSTILVPRLRQLTKRGIRGCYGCKKFQVTAFSNPPVGNLPTDRTEGSSPFEVVGLDFAGSIGYKLKTKKEGKAYILLFACSLTRAVHLELLPNQTAEEFIKHLKWFIARRGRSRKIYSYNGRTFVATAKWLNGVAKHEQLQN